MCVGALPRYASRVNGDGAGIPPGWYPDPLGLPQMRWWDTQGWTEFTSEARAPMIVQPAAEAGAGAARRFSATDRLAYADAERSSREHAEPADDPAAAATGGVGAPTPEEPPLAATLRQLEAPAAGTMLSAEADPRPAAEASPRPAARHANAARSAGADAAERAAGARAGTDSRGPTRTYTATSWVIAVLWLIQLAAAAAAIFLFDQGHNTALIWVIWVGAYVVSVGIAAYDGLLLSTYGYERPASAWWALLSPLVYIVMRLTRTFRETGKGFALLAGCVGSGLVVVAANLLVPAFLIASLPQTFAAEASASVVRTVAALGIDLVVDCPPDRIPLVPGTAMTCYAEAANGHMDTVRVSLVRQNYWIAWQVDSVGSWLLQR